jgi:hypothetical protein
VGFAGNTHDATPAAYVATFQRMAKIFRQYSPTTLVEWSLSLAPQGMLWPDTSTTPPDYWVGKYDPTSNPGGADVVSMSFFEAKTGSNFDADIRGGPRGLDWLASFAAQNGVKIALSDVATGVSNSPGANQGCPCSNDAAMMQHLVDWNASLPAGQFTHFLFSPWAPADDLIASGNSAIQATWKQSWGGALRRELVEGAQGSDAALGRAGRLAPHGAPARSSTLSSTNSVTLQVACEAGWR